MTTLDSLDDQIVAQCVKESGFDFAKAAAALKARCPEDRFDCSPTALRYRYATIASARAAAEEATSKASAVSTAASDTATPVKEDMYKDLTFSQMMDIVDKTTADNMVKKEQIFSRVLGSLGDAPLDEALYAEVSSEAQLIQQIIDDNRRKRQIEVLEREKVERERAERLQREGERERLRTRHLQGGADAEGVAVELGRRSGVGSTERDAIDEIEDSDEVVAAVKSFDIEALMGSCEMDRLLSIIEEDLPDECSGDVDDSELGDVLRFLDEAARREKEEGAPASTSSIEHKEAGGGRALASLALARPQEVEGGSAAPAEGRTAAAASVAASTYAAPPPVSVQAKSTFRSEFIADCDDECDSDDDWQRARQRSKSNALIAERIDPRLAASREEQVYIGSVWRGGGVALGAQRISAEEGRIRADAELPPAPQPAAEGVVAPLHAAEAAAEAAAEVALAARSSGSLVGRRPGRTAAAPKFTSDLSLRKAGVLAAAEMARK